MTMYRILDDIVARHGESDHYIKLLNVIESADKVITADSSKVLYVSSELKNTLRGLTFLLFYNLIESTLRESVLRIYDTFKANQVCFNTLKKEIKVYILDQLKANISSDKFIQAINDISLDICHKSIDSKKLFSGNIDRDVINDTAKTYGFSTDTSYADTKHGEYLKKIKKNRNDLAHGNASFSEIGKHVTTIELEEIHKCLLNYLEGIVANIEQYLDSKLYLNGVG